MKTYLCNEYKPWTLDELKNGILEFWKNLTPAVCQQYINHLQRVIPKVIEMGGAASGFIVSLLSYMYILFAGYWTCVYRMAQPT